MPKFIVKYPFQFGGLVRREESILTIDKSDLEVEMAMGRHPDNGKPISGLLNHCEPADDATAEFVGDFYVQKDKPAPPTWEEKEAELAAIRKEFDDIGAAYHPGWTTGRLKKELIRAKKERGA